VYRILFLILTICCLVAGNIKPAFADWGEDQYAIAADHYRNGRWQQAVGQFQLLIDKEPDHSRTGLAHFFQGESHIQLEAYAASVPHFTEFIDKVPQHALRTRAIFRRAEANYLIGNDADSIVQLQALLNDESASAYFEFALVYLGEMLQRLPDSESQAKARQFFEQALAKYPNSSLSNRCRLGLAQWFQRSGQYQDAQRFLAFLIESNDPTVSQEAVVSRASMWVEEQQWAKAVQALNDATLSELPADLKARGYYWRGRAEMGAQQWPVAADFLEKALAGLTEDHLAEACIYDAAIAQWRATEFKDADRLLAESVRRWPSGDWAADSRYLRIQLALLKGDPAEVQALVNDFAANCAKHPLWPKVLEAEGRAAFAQGSYAQSVRSFGQLIELVDSIDPKTVTRLLPTWHYLLAVSEIANKNDEAGMRNLDQTLRLLSAQSPEEKARDRELLQSTQFARSTSLLKQQRWTDALSQQSDFLAEFPNSPYVPDVWADRIRCFAVLERWKECDQSAADVESVLAGLAKQTQSPVQPQIQQQANRLEDALASVSLKVAQQYYQSQDLPNAKIWYQRAAKSSQSEISQQGFSGLAWAEFQSKDLQGSQRAFQLLMDRFPDSPLTAEAGLKRAEMLADDGKMVESRNIVDALIRRFTTWDRLHMVYAFRAKLELANRSKASIGRAISDLEQAAAVGMKRQSTESKSQVPIDAYLYDLAWLHAELEQEQSSIAAFTKLSLSYPQSRFWVDATFRIAQNHFDQNRLAVAKESLTSLFNAIDTHKAQQANGSLGPDGLEANRLNVPDEVLAHAYYLRSMLAVKETDWPGVEQWTTRLTNEFPEQSIRWMAEYWRGEAIYRSGDYLRAATVLSIVAERTTNQFEPWVAMTHLRLAQSLGQRGKWDQALQVATKAKERFKDFRQTYELDYLIGRANAIDAKFPVARSAYQRVIDSKDGRRTETAAMAQWMVGETHFHEEQYALAAQAYHQTENLYRFPQWQAAALLQAGKCYEHLRQDADAISVYRQLLKEHGDNALAGQARDRMNRVVERQNLTATGDRNRSR